MNPEYLQLAGHADRRRDRQDGDRADLRVRRPRGRAGAERRSARSGAHGAARAVLGADDHDDPVPADSDGGAGAARAGDGDLLRRRRSPKRRAACSARAAGCSSCSAPSCRCSATCRATCWAARARCSRSRATASCRRRSRASIRASTRRTSPSSSTPCIVGARGDQQQLHAAGDPRQRRGADACT